MKRICLLSDTHGHLDEGILKHVRNSDEVWHAGDIGNTDVADKLAALKPLRAVHGNIDGAELRRMFKRDAVFETEGVKTWITHIGGYPGRFPASILSGIAAHKPDLFICGHSHILKVMHDKELELLHMNPGAAGHHGFHHVRTLLLFSLNQGRILDASVVELGRRGQITAH